MVLVGYGIAAFLPPLLLRRFHLPLGEVGLIAGTVSGIGGGIGTMIGGLAGDRWGAGQPRRLALIAALAAFVSAPLLIGGILSTSLAGLVCGTFLGTLSVYAYVAPAFAQVHDFATARSRATVTSIFYLVTNLVGLGLGPPLIGAISDRSAQMSLALDSNAFRSLCFKASSLQHAVCANAIADGLANALVVISVLPLLAAMHFFFASYQYEPAKILLAAPQAH